MGIVNQHSRGERRLQLKHEHFFPPRVAFLISTKRIGFVLVVVKVGDQKEPKYHHHVSVLLT